MRPFPSTRLIHVGGIPNRRSIMVAREDPTDPWITITCHPQQTSERFEGTRNDSHSQLPLLGIPNSSSTHRLLFLLPNGLLFRCGAAREFQLCITSKDDGVQAKHLPWTGQKKTRPHKGKRNSCRPQTHHHHHHRVFRTCAPRMIVRCNLPFPGVDADSISNTGGLPPFTSVSPFAFVIENQFCAIMTKRHRNTKQHCGQSDCIWMHSSQCSLTSHASKKVIAAALFSKVPTTSTTSSTSGSSPDVDSSLRCEGPSAARISGCRTVTPRGARSFEDGTPSNCASGASNNCHSLDEDAYPYPRYNCAKQCEILPNNVNSPKHAPALLGCQGCVVLSRTRRTSTVVQAHFSPARYLGPPAYRQFPPARG